MENPRKAFAREVSRGQPRRTKACFGIRLGLLSLAGLDLGCAASTTTAVAASSVPELYRRTYDRQYAFVIGVEDYVDEGDARGDLVGPAFEACRMANYLEEQGAEVACCFERNEQGKLDYRRPNVPTRTTLEALAKDLDASDSRVIYYLAGHAATINVTGGGTASQQERTLFFMPQPGSEAAPTPRTIVSTDKYATMCQGTRSPAALRSSVPPKAVGDTATSNEFVEERAAREQIKGLINGVSTNLNQQQMLQLRPYTLDLTQWYDSGAGLLFSSEPPLSSVFIADGCDLQVDTQTTEHMGLRHSTPLRKRGSLWITATSGGETARTFQGTSLFTTTLLEGLSGRADGAGDGVIDRNDLEAYLSKTYPAKRKELDDEHVTPKVFYGHGEGQTFFINPTRTRQASTTLDDIEPCPACEHAGHWYWHLPSAAALVVGALWLTKLNEYHAARDRYADAAVPSTEQLSEANAKREDAQTWGAGALLLGGVGVATSTFIIFWDFHE